MLVIGIVAYFYPQQVNYLGVIVTVGYPYRDLGTALIVVGFVALIGGAAMKNEAERLDDWRRRGARAGKAQPQVPDSGLRYCTNCGQSLRPTDAYCSRCGSKA